MTDFSATRASFHLPDGVIYLDGNSLGPLPRAAGARMEQVMQDEWGEMLIRGWNDAGWMEQSISLGDRIGRLVGAERGHVMVGDTLSIKVYQALAAALSMNPERKVVLSDTGNFPSDLYMAQGLIGTLDRGLELRTVAPENVAEALTDDVAVLMLTHVDYRTGRMHDMGGLTRAAKAQGIVTIWDLAHSAGAVPVNLSECGAEFAVGCTYKYLNGGPGAPAFIYVAPALAETARPALSGWLGHESPFSFEPDYRPGKGIHRMRVGTPPVLAFAALDSALSVWDRVDMTDVRRASIELSERFIGGIEAHCPELQLASPRDAAERGSQVSFRHPEGYAIMQALIAEGVIGDFRAPDILRFGFTPLYLTAAEVDRAVETLAGILADARWDNPAFKARKAVT